ncbi:MAG: hypothetical protein IPK59_00625 [Rhodospirillaceae bacterium]|nr:hypothetical protein [Rhodospirillaceae bacterium]
MVDALAGQDPVTRLKARLADAVAAADLAQAAFTSAAMAYELSPGHDTNARKLDDARAALTAARERVEGLTAAAQAAEAQAAATASAATAADRAKRWDAAEALAETRKDIAADIEKLAADLAGKFKQLQDVTAQIAEAMPYRPDSSEKTGTFLILPEVEITGRYALVKCGLRWAGNWPWELKDLPTLSSYMAKACDQLAQLRKVRG